MAANLGQKSTVVDGLALCLDAENSSSAPTTAQLVDSGLSAVDDGPDDSIGWQNLVFGSKYFVAFTSLGSNRLAYSTDGINWTSQAAVQANWWFGMTYGNGKFVGIARGSVGSNAGDQIVQYASESDLTSWTGVEPPEDNNFKDLPYGNGKFVAFSRDGTNRVMYASDSDVTSWSTASAAEANEWKSVTYGDGYFVAVSKDGTNRVMYSTDGISWTAASAAASVDWRRVTYGDGYFVAVSNMNLTSGATTSNAIMWAKSSDPSSWTLTNTAQAGVYNGIAYGRGRFVACTYADTTDKFFFADINHTNKWNDISLSKVRSNLLDNPLFSSSVPSYIELNIGGGSQLWNMKSPYYSEFNFAALNYSIEFWINRYDGYYIMDQRFTSVSTNSYITFNASQSNRLSYRPYNATAIFDTDTDNPTATDATWTGWRHYVISREGTGSNECKLYYNGSLIAQGTDANSHGNPGLYKIGVRSYDNASPFKGRLGLFKVYKGKALSAAEVLQNYNATKERYV